MFLDLINKKEDKVKDFDMGDKIGYAFGDIGCALFFGFVSNYLMLFYTDVLGITAASVGTLFIVARIWDAIKDTIMGTLIDKKGNTKYGKFRPYVVWFGIPLVIVGIICFTAFPLPQNLKLPFAYITYITFGMLYTAVNIPYGSLASVMTSDPNQRTSLSVFRNMGSLVGNMFVLLVVPMVVFNSENIATAKGFLTCAIIIGILSLTSLLLTFRLTRERVVSVNASKSSVGETVKTLFKNRAFIGISLASFTLMGSMFTIQSLTAYLFKDYFKAPNLIGIGGMLGILSSFLVIPFSGHIVKKLGKKETAVCGAIFSAVIYAIMFFIPNLNVYVYMTLSFIGGLGSGLINTIIYALVSDAIDYQEYISGKRNEGMVYSSYSLARKLSQALSGGIGGFALAFLGYEAGVAEQLPEVGIGIKNIAIGVSLVGLILTALILLFVYNLSKKRLAEVQGELEKRKANEATESNI
ncbi:MAG: MFS transporter [Eubacteriales bacterium]|nr:MFS transporter [Eubacteriales bacterium]